MTLWELINKLEGMYEFCDGDSTQVFMENDKGAAGIYDVYHIDGDIILR